MNDMTTKYGSHYGHKGISGAYDGAGAGPKQDPLKGIKMPRGPKDPAPSHKGN